jgi:hypothetical protein
MNKRTISQQEKVDEKDFVIFINSCSLVGYKVLILLGVGDL